MKKRGNEREGKRASSFLETAQNSISNVPKELPRLSHFLLLSLFHSFPLSFSFEFRETRARDDAFSLSLSLSLPARTLLSLSEETANYLHNPTEFSGTEPKFLAKLWEFALFQSIIGSCRRGHS